MYLESRWLINRKVAYMQFVHDVDAEYVEYIKRAVSRFIAEADGNSIHIVVETIPGLRIRIGIKTLHDMVNFMANGRIDYMIQVGPATEYHRFIGQALARSLRLKYQTFNSIEDALSFLEASDISSVKVAI